LDVVKTLKKFLEINELNQKFDVNKVIQLISFK
jgi:hypothetical protein